MELQLQQLQKFWLGLPHAKLSRIIVVLSVVYVAFLFSQLFWLLWPVPQTQPLLPASQLYSQSSSGGITSQGIVSQNLFGEANAKPDTKPQPVVSDAPETTLNVRLTGIVAVSQDDGAGLAIIESQGRQETYSVDAPITGTRAKLARVLPDRVILDVSGRFETLMLDGIEFSRTVAMPTKPKKIVNNATSPTPPRNELANRRQELINEPGKLFDYIKISPERRNGELIGYRLTPGKDPELFKQVGLQANDLAIAINGFQLTDMKQAMSAINELRTSTDANITIERDGQVMDVQFSL
ncbi:type II secretion system protein GspC [Pseudoalteromonas piscicida]|uniref:Type II secretion system protein GspC n=1 Tax=Pseudoalteromonas piscicida TaxID=43662 RepID=A0AAD0REM6_PSEO7|nr:type II secretion system protein GspC [Pseudoalteromonas piscicida]ASD65910.1 type II secretion system protein GspC [Pseudoalteromonas piscicida]AXR00947.1 type II secretion system protein GspC [Pseudoalteromonas piscicida]